MASVAERITQEWGSSYDLRTQNGPVHLQQVRRALSASLPPPAPFIRADQVADIQAQLQPPESPPEVSPEAGPGDTPPLLMRVLPLTEEELLAVETAEATAAGFDPPDPSTRHIGWLYGAPVYVDSEATVPMLLANPGNGKDKQS